MGRGMTETLFLFLNLMLDIMFAVIRSNWGEILISTGLAGELLYWLQAPFSHTLYLSHKTFWQFKLAVILSVAFSYSFIVLLLCSINISKLLEDLQPNLEG